MDYEKKYNEALAWMRELYPGLHGATKEDAEHYFPELLESEDERIRKTLVEYFGPQAQLDFIRGVPIQKIRDWLEKQKEHHIPWYDYQKSKEAGYTIVPNEEYEQLIKQKEQKPVEWSEENKKAWDALYKHFSVIYPGDGQFRDTKLSNRQITDFLKALRPSWKPSKEQMEALAYASKVLSSALYPVAAKASEELESIREQLKKL